jgi:membrane-bound lytic murein transglycosylase F
MFIPLLILNACSLDQVTTDAQKQNFDLAENKVLRVITLTNPTGYFLYKGQPMGYEYELLKQFTAERKMDFEVILADNLADMFDKLLAGEGDLIAYDLTVTQERKKLVDFTAPHLKVRQVLVQRKPNGWRKMAGHVLDKQLVREPMDLEQKIVHVEANSAFDTRLAHLQDEIGAEIDVKRVGGQITTHELIRRVAEGEIEYTIADEHQAKLHQTYYPQLDVGTPISFQQHIAWAVRKDSESLKQAVDQWLEKVYGTAKFNMVYNKYFNNKKSIKSRMSSQFLSVNSGQLSPYDDLIKQYADSVNWDWRLLASLIFQESQFNPTARSWVGAKGLMQLMPGTASDMGIKKRKLEKPEPNLKAGTRYLNHLWEYWGEIPDSTERIKFVLASYNVGPGHVADARRLAKAYNHSSVVWDDNVAEYLLKKQNEQFYTHPAVKYGYCRGEEPYNYVKKILGRYKRYKELLNSPGAKSVLTEDEEV